MEDEEKYNKWIQCSDQLDNNLDVDWMITRDFNLQLHFNPFNIPSVTLSQYIVLLSDAWTLYSQSAMCETPGVCTERLFT